MSVPAPMIAAAAFVASRLGPGPGNRSVRDAIIAWWAAEEGYRWPPNSLNNPGFMRPPGQEQFGTATGTVPGAPGVFKRFSDAGHGVDAFVDRVATSGHYGGIRSAIRAVASGSTSAVAIANAVGASPWGTNGTTMRVALAYVQRVVGATPAVEWRSAGGSGGSGADATLVSYTDETVASYLGIAPGTILTTGLIRQLAAKFAAEGTEKEGDVFTYYIDFFGKAAGTVPGPHKVYNAQTFGGAPRSPSPVDVGLQIVGAAGDVLRQGVLLVAILVVVILGLYTLTRSGEAPA